MSGSCRRGSGSYLLAERGGGGGGGSRVDAPTTTGRPSRRLPPQGAPRVAGDAERAGRSQRGGYAGVCAGVFWGVCWGSF